MIKLSLEVFPPPFLTSRSVTRLISQHSTDSEHKQGPIKKEVVYPGTTQSELKSLTNLNSWESGEHAWELALSVLGSTITVAISDSRVAECRRGHSTSREKECAVTQ